jgi:hypothetical protein
MGMKVANYFVERIGNQAIKAFAENALKIIADKGLSQGVGIILKGILSGGVRAGATAAGSAVAGGAAATGAAAGSAAVPVVGWIVAAAIVALQVISWLKNKLGKLAEKLGIDLGIKRWLQENFGRPLGWLLNLVVKGAILVVGIPSLIGLVSLTSIIGPVVIGSVVGLTGYQIYQDNLVSSLVPPIQSSQQDQFSNTTIPVVTPGDVVVPPVTIGQVSRQDAINMAMALNGKVMYAPPYVWSHLPPNAVNPRWKSGAAGLDCIGFVRWVYLQLTGKFTGYIRSPSASGVGGIYPRAKANVNKNPNEYYFIDKSELKPGDMVMGTLRPEHNNMPGHIGIYLGKDTEGRNLYIHTNATGTPVKVCSDEYRYHDPGNGRTNSVCTWGFYVRPGKSLIDFTDD